MRFYNPSVLRACYKPRHYLAFTALILVFSLGLSGHWLVCLVCLVCLLPRLLPLSHSEDFCRDPRNRTGIRVTAVGTATT